MNLRKQEVETYVCHRYAHTYAVGRDIRMSPEDTLLSLSPKR